MDRIHKPHGYSSVSPYIVANGAQGVIDFLIKSFDARQTRRYDMPDGSIMHAEVHIDDTVVMIDDGADDNPAFPIWVHVYVCPTWMRHTGGLSKPMVSPSMSPSKGKAIPTAALG